MVTCPWHQGAPAVLISALVHLLPLKSLDVDLSFFLFVTGKLWQAQYIWMALEKGLGYFLVDTAGCCLHSAAWLYGSVRDFPWSVSVVFVFIHLLGLEPKPCVLRARQAVTHVSALGCLGLWVNIQS